MYIAVGVHGDSFINYTCGLLECKSFSKKWDDKKVLNFFGGGGDNVPFH